MFVRESISWLNDLNKKSGHRTNSWSERDIISPKTGLKAHIFLFMH